MSLSPQDACKTLREICGKAPVLPVLVVDDAAQAAGLAKALVAGGLPALEVTLRTPAALEVIKAMSEVPGGIVGAGTLVSAEDARAAKQAGAQFGVSPGVTDELVKACEEIELPLLAGVSTASEVMAHLARGYDMAKFFPAEQSGGAAYLKSVSGPLPQMTFCPTGGVNLENAGDYLSLPNVICVGGSWVAPASLVTAGNWDEIEKLAKRAAGLSF